MNSIPHNPTHNFFMMQDIDLRELRELIELVHQVCKPDERLITRIMKRVLDISHTFLNMGVGFDGNQQSEVWYNWHPVKFYLALERSGKYEEYDGFRIEIHGNIDTPFGSGDGNVVAIFFTTEPQAAKFQIGVFDQSQLGGYRSRLPALTGSDA